MQLMQLLYKTLEKELPFIHKIRLSSLMSISDTATRNNKLSLTSLGRAHLGKKKTGSYIQKVDRLIGNPHLQKERVSIYKAMSSHFIQKDISPRIHVDWSCINAQTNLYVLRALFFRPECNQYPVFA